MKHDEIRGTILTALEGTNPMHALRDSELTARVGLGMRFIGRALHELHQEGHVANRDVWPPGELPYKCYWRVYVAQADSATPPHRPRDKAREEIAAKHGGWAYVDEPTTVARQMQKHVDAKTLQECLRTAKPVLRPLDKGPEERQRHKAARAAKDACATNSYVPRSPRLATTPRKCLCCGKPFASQGPHNRLCTTCRGKSVGPYDL